jgi:hypothetical protein
MPLSCFRIGTGVLLAAVALWFAECLPAARSPGAINLAFEAELRSLDYCPSHLPGLGRPYLRARVVVTVRNLGTDRVALAAPAAALVNPVWRVKSANGKVTLHALEDSMGTDGTAPEAIPDVRLLSPGAEWTFDGFATAPLSQAGVVSGPAIPDGEATLTMDAALFAFPERWAEAWQGAVPNTVLVTTREKVTLRFRIRRPDVLNDCG